VHPRSSQIGVAFSDEASIGAGLTGLRFRAMSCDSGDLALPPPLFFDFRCKQSTYSIRRLGLPCATLGWPLGHPWVTQTQSQSQSAEGRMPWSTVYSMPAFG